MLSILIPTYHYNAYPLAQELEKQALEANLIFELICVDDGSFSELNIANQKINQLINCKFIEAKKNVGRSASRKFLAEQAQYPWLLFIDADVLPKNKDFLTKYLNKLTPTSEAIFGGFAYKESSYSKNKSLRFTFGKQREEVDAAIRNKTPYKVIISANFLVKKPIYLELIKQNTENSYGMDYLLGALLKKYGIKVEHINNEVFHFGIDENIAFLKKTEHAMHTLSNLSKSKEITSNDISLLRAYYFLKLFYLQHLFGKFLGYFDRVIKKNLTEENPSLFLFDLYRLGYFCRIHH
ncbi:glycosyltransferase family 2 protein [Xanthomarina sp.]|uniref:glycosyltransferase family 2 protein n=1 Tax=Xanthomarina sp. TaxID=1931211 RepID=UPI002CB82D09|nr:glycosyltransferase [Xanthomarina sp.]HLV38631.1 glycosyltransferase [Xanthomarina sp.]